MRKLSGSSYSLIVLLIVMLVIIGLSMRLEYLASKLLPVLISSIVFILAFIALVGEIKAKNRHDIETTENTIEKGLGGKVTSEAKKYLLIIAAWIIGFFLAIYVIGFVIAGPLFVGSYMKRYGSSWLSTIITTGIFAVVFYTVFNIVLKADLYKGQLPIWLGF